MAKLKEKYKMSRKTPEQKAAISAEKEYLYLQSRVRADAPKCEQVYCQKMADSALYALNQKRRLAKMPNYGQTEEKKNFYYE
jgi:hypothetical protein